MPLIIESPIFNVPFSTNTVAIGPLFLSSSASIIVPTAVCFGFAFNSCISATNKIIFNKSSIPIPFLADTGTRTASPPHSSGNTPFSASCCFTLSIFDSGLSILLIATIIGISAALI